MTTLSKDELYPLLFEPMYRETAWGGRKLAGVIGRELPAEGGPFGEAWDICDREGAESVISQVRYPALRNTAFPSARIRAYGK